MNEFGQAPALEEEIINEYKEMNLEQATAFVEAVKVQIDEHNKLSRCVDGRYEGENLPMVAKPGGDAGDIMVLLAALNSLGKEITFKEVKQLVLEACGGNDNFQFHSDDHAEHDKVGIGMGCGHLKLAKNHPVEYGLTEQQALEEQACLDELFNEGSKPVILHGNHTEQAVMVVESESYGIKPSLRDGETSTEVFVYQKTTHEQQLKLLAELTATKILGDKQLTDDFFTAVLEANAKQLSETVERLAAGKPVYTIKIDEQGRVEVTETKSQE